MSIVPQVVLLAHGEVLQEPRHLGRSVEYLSGLVLVVAELLVPSIEGRECHRGVLAWPRECPHNVLLERFEVSVEARNHLYLAGVFVNGKVPPCKLVLRGGAEVVVAIVPRTVVDPPCPVHVVADVVPQVLDQPNHLRGSVVDLRWFEIVVVRCLVVAVQRAGWRGDARASGPSEVERILTRAYP